MKAATAPAASASASDITSLVHEVSLAWVATWRDRLAKDGRAMEGGWPGTRSEAHALVVDRIAPALVHGGLPLRDADATTVVARSLYAAAKRVWLSEARSER